MRGPSYRLDAPVVSRRDGVLRADDFDDLYFDVHMVWLKANMCLSMARIFVKNCAFGPSYNRETGFGTGLNF